MGQGLGGPVAHVLPFPRGALSVDSQVPKGLPWPLPPLWGLLQTAPSPGFLRPSGRDWEPESWATCCPAGRGGALVTQLRAGQPRAGRVRRVCQELGPSASPSPYFLQGTDRKAPEASKGSGFLKLSTSGPGPRFRATCPPPPPLPGDGDVPRGLTPLWPLGQAQMHMWAG